MSGWISEKMAIDVVTLASLELQICMSCRKYSNRTDVEINKLQLLSALLVHLRLFANAAQN